jgi:diguanylate cyclase (GGDEF)-like protein
MGVFHPSGGLWFCVTLSLKEIVELPEKDDTILRTNYNMILESPRHDKKQSIFWDRNQFMATYTNDELAKLIERRNNELASMIEIGKALTSSLEVHAVLEMIMKQVDRLIKPKAWSLLLVDEVSRDLYFEIAVSPVAEQLKGVTLKQGEGIAGWVASHGIPLLIPDVSADPRFAQHVDTQLSYKTRSIIAVPMKIQERVIGVIELVNSYDELMFDDLDQSILTAIADFAAIALVNARNFDRINELVVTDDLTGLYNSRHFGQLIEGEFLRAERYQTELSLVFLDLDRLKSINDVHGHLVGSRMLSELGRLIGSHIRDCDHAARYGGDEFVIILPQTGKQQAVSMAEKMLELMRSTKFFSDDNQAICLTASFGVATYPQDGGSRTELLRAADIAMYNAKASGRNCVKGFEAAPP